MENVSRIFLNTKNCSKQNYFDFIAVCNIYETLKSNELCTFQNIVKYNPYLVFSLSQVSFLVSPLKNIGIFCLSFRYSLIDQRKRRESVRDVLNNSLMRAFKHVFVCFGFVID